MLLHQAYFCKTSLPYTQACTYTSVGCSNSEARYSKQRGDATRYPISSTVPAQGCAYARSAIGRCARCITSGGVPNEAQRQQPGETIVRRDASSESQGQADLGQREHPIRSSTRGGRIMCWQRFHASSLPRAPPDRLPVAVT